MVEHRGRGGRGRSSARRAGILGPFAAVALAATFASAAGQPLDYTALRLGAPLSAQPPAPAFAAYACGSNGGPPLQPLAGFADFSRCTPEPDGLYEVRFAYDDTARQEARSTGDVAAAWGLGTMLDYFPIVPSALFDRQGTLRAIRIVTDPVPELRKDPFLKIRPRSEHYLLQLHLMDRFGMTDADCHDLPLPPGASPVIGMAVNRVCARTDAASGLGYRIESRFYRRPGERDADPFTGALTAGQFLSETRAEIRG